MKNKKLFTILSASIFQVLIIGTMIALSMQPLLTGKPLLLKVMPVDPRDLFRGDYVILNYSFSRLNLNTIEHDIEDKQKFTFGDVLYLSLKKKGKFYEPTQLSTKKPESETFLQVINQRRFTFRQHSNYNIMRLKAGIESYFTDSKTAKKLEKLVNTGKIKVSTTVMVTASGKARIKKIHYPQKFK